MATIATIYPTRGMQDEERYSEGESFQREVVSSRKEMEGIRSWLRKNVFKLMGFSAFVCQGIIFSRESNDNRELPLQSMLEKYERQNVLSPESDDTHILKMLRERNKTLEELGLNNLSFQDFVNRERDDAAFRRAVSREIMKHRAETSNPEE